jgi:hypothetical protein
MKAATCQVQHSSTHTLKAIVDLPESQAGSWRHKCAACAYELGLSDGRRLAADAKRAEQKGSFVAHQIHDRRKRNAR